jgi:hypothetical protein
MGFIVMLAVIVLGFSITLVKGGGYLASLDPRIPAPKAGRVGQNDSTQQ